nr:MAG: RNA dependent RNA polymerase [Leviviridae sp.]
MRKRARYVKPKLRKEAIDSFIAVNALVANTPVNLDRRLVADARHFITVVLERLATRYDPSNIQVSLDYNLLMDLWRFGPGAANGIRGTHAADKIQQDMTCTDSCVPLVVRLRRNNAYFFGHDFANKKLGYVVIQGSRLTTVPKNETVERTIAIEPSGNMALQLAAGRYLEMALCYIGLDITCQQPKNKLMALRGSKDGSIATIDLKEASNMVSIELVRQLMPPSWVDLLMAVRSPEIDVPGYGWTQLNMISTMGNGFTFPLMTLMLCSLIYAYRAQRGGPNLRIDWSSTCVFGDDIIVPTHEYTGICEVLHQAGLVVNHDKSYHEGPFRESCGGDYWNGYDVTPFYAKSLANDRHVYTVINQVYEWCARHNILLYRSLIFLRQCLRGKVHVIPEWHNPDEGVLSSGCPRRYTYLHTVIPRSRLPEDNHFAIMLISGGYIEAESGGPGLFYQPRPFQTKAVVRKARLPQGYLDGSDPVKRVGSITSFIEAYLFLMN